MVKKILTVIALLITLSSSASLAQDVQSFSSKVDDNFKNKHPDWKFVSKAIEGTNITYNWFIGNKGLQCLVSYTASEQAAKKDYDNINRGFSVGPKAELKDLGDEAVLYQTKGYDRSSMVLRKSNVVVLIYSPTFAAADSLAREIAGLIPNK
jgi:hypothetical protein